MNRALHARKVHMATIVDAEPEAIAINPERTAVIVIDMQRDFLEPGGFGESLGNDVSLLGAAIEPIKALVGRGAQEEDARHPHA